MPQPFETLSPNINAFKMTSIKPRILHHGTIAAYILFIYFSSWYKGLEKALNIVCNFSPKHLYTKDGIIWGSLIMNALNHCELCKWEAWLSLPSLENSLRQHTCFWEQPKSYAEHSSHCIKKIHCRRKYYNFSARKWHWRYI